MLTLGALQYAVLLMIGLGTATSGLLMAMDKFYLFNRAGIKHPCFFCIIFWASLAVSVFFMWDTKVWIALFVSLGSASFGRSLMKAA